MLSYTIAIVLLLSIIRHGSPLSWRDDLRSIAASPRITVRGTAVVLIMPGSPKLSSSCCGMFLFRFALCALRYAAFIHDRKCSGHAGPALGAPKLDRRQRYVLACFRRLSSPANWLRIPAPAALCDSDSQRAAASRFEKPSRGQLRTLCQLGEVCQPTYTQRQLCPPLMFTCARMTRRPD